MDQLCDLCQRHLTCAEPIIDTSLGIRPSTLMAVVEPCHHASAGRCTERTAIGLPKSHTLVGKTIDIRCFEMLLSVTTEHPTSEIVAVDENDIWLVRHIQRFLSESSRHTPYAVTFVPAVFTFHASCPTGYHLRARILTATNLLMTKQLLGTIRK